MNTNNINISVNAVNRTSKTFNEISQKVNNTFTQIRTSTRSVFGGMALFNILKGSLQTLTHFVQGTMKEFADLADSAALAGESSPSYLYALTKSLDLLGIKNVSIDTLTKSMSRMTKATGQIGVKGFIKTLAAISKIDNEQQRLNETMRIFGKEAGASFNVITRGGIRSVEALENITNSWQTNIDSHINAFAELDGAWTRICDDIQLKFRASIAQIILATTGGTELTEHRIMIFYEKVKKIFKGVFRAIVNPFKAAIAACGSLVNGLVSFLATALGGLVQLFDEQTGNEILDWADKQYQDMQNYNKMWEEASEVIVSNLSGHLDPTTTKEYEAAIKKWDFIFAEKKLFDDSIGGELTAAADSIVDASQTMKDAASTINKSMKTTGFVSAGSAEALKIKTISRDWILEDVGKGTASSVQVGPDPIGVLRSECRKITDLEAKILLELQNKQLIGEI